jgi:predicted dienelactone hydrolase
MHTADALLVGCLFVVGAAIAIPYTREVLWRRRWLLSGILATVVASEIVLHRFYWQLLPADLAYLSLAIACAAISSAQGLRLRVIALFSLLLASVSLASLIVLPVFSLPRPDGPYAVGTRIVHLVDESRSDSAFPSGHRELMVQVWYPAESASGPLAPYRRWRETTLLSSYDAFHKTHSHLNAPVAKRGGPFPVLLFNPAWGGERTQNTYQTEDLASHGYIVIAIDHTHNSSLVAFPDGQVVKATRMPSIDDFRHATFQQQMRVAGKELDAQVADDIFVLNSFSAMNSSTGSPWYRALDMQRVGALGHSFGGAVAVETCFRDGRVKAAMNMDGWMYGSISKDVLRKPLFVMYESGWPPDAKVLAEESASRAPSDRMDIWDRDNLERTLAGYGGYVLTIEGTKHMNFADRSLYSPLRSLTDSGPINPALAHRIINAYTLAFFDYALRGKVEPLMNESRSPYAMARFERWGNASTTARARSSSVGN